MNVAMSQHNCVDVRGVGVGHVKGPLSIYEKKWGDVLLVSPLSVSIFWWLLQVLACVKSSADGATQSRFHVLWERLTIQAPFPPTFGVRPRKFRLDIRGMVSLIFSISHSAASAMGLGAGQSSSSNDRVVPAGSSLPAAVVAELVEYVQSRTRVAIQDFVRALISGPNTSSRI